MVANEILYNKNISFKAKGLYAYLFSKPDTWDFSSNRMVLETKDGRKSVMAMLRELEQAGYLQRTKLPSGKMEYTLKHSLSAERELRVQEPKSQNGTVPKGLSAESSPISNKEEKVISIDTSNTSDVPSQDIVLFIESFKDVNPSFDRLFSNKTERSCAERLIRKYGITKMIATAENLPDIISKPYAPRITTPYELERNLGKLLAFVEQNKNIIKDKKPKIAFI